MKKGNRKVHNSRVREGNQAVTAVLYTLAVLAGVICVYPMYYVLIQSISEPKYALIGNQYLLPKGFSLVAYKSLVTDNEMWRAYANTILYVVPTTILMVITCTTVAYGLHYKRLVGKKILTMFLLIPMYFSGGMVPSFLLHMSLGLYDNPFAIIIPASFSIWDIILVRSYFRTIPDSLSEAAKIDGAGVLQVLTKVFVPLGKPIYAVIAVYTIVGMWNSWFSASIYLPHTKWQPLQMYLRRVLVERSVDLTQEMSVEMVEEMARQQLSNAQMKYAIIIFCSLPVLCTYPFFQKYFVKGMVLGSLKE